VAERHPEVGWVFLYTREAHPGERVGHHDTFGTKLARARLLRDELGIRRPILVDDLDGSAHRAYGSLPNMSWVFARGGRVVYKANWTNAANVEGFLERFLAARASQQDGRRWAMYETEQVEFRDIDDEAFQQRLQRNGSRAVAEIDRARHLWARRPSA
jgi:hypothetical protein